MRRTDDLIAQLAAQGARPAGSPASRLAAAALTGAGAAALGAAALGVRPEIAALAPDEVTAAKVLLAVLLAVVAGALAARLATPGRPVASRGVLLAAVAAGGAAPMLVIPVAPAATGLSCAALAALLSLPALAAALVAIRPGAVVRPRRTGAAAGLMAGAAGLAGFALHCPAAAVAPMLAWYALAALALAGLGSLIAPRLGPSVT